MNEIEAMAKLSPINASALAGWRIGDLADVPGLGRVQVVEIQPPSELIVRTSKNGMCRVCWRIMKPVR